MVAPDLSRSALVLIDVQVDFADGGASPVPGTTEALPNMARLRTAYQRAALPVVHVVRLYDGDDVDLVRRAAIGAGAAIVRPGSAGSQVVPELRDDATADLDAVGLRRGDIQQLGPHEVVVWKPRWSAFHRTPLHQHLSDLSIHTVVFAGCNYPNCPRASIYDASAYDYRVLLVSDAVSGVDRRHLDEAGAIGVVHADTRTVVRELRRLPTS